MIARQTPWPRYWLMTDERMGAGLWSAIERLPRGESGVVLRHYTLAGEDRADVGTRVADLCARRRLMLAVAGDELLAARLGAELLHNPADRPAQMAFSRSVHSISEAEAARRDGASLVFVSPVYATRSHPGRQPLGIERACRIAQTAGVSAIALGGMRAADFPPLARRGFHGWAAIDAWLED